MQNSWVNAARRRLLPLAWPAAIALLAASAWVMWDAGTLLVVTRDIPRPEALLALASHETERLPETAAMARRNPAAVILLTEPVAPTPQNCFRCDERVDWLVSLGVDRQRIVVLPTRVKNTYDEAAAALEHCRTHAIDDLMVITSPYHTRRSAATFSAVFENSGIAVGVIPALDESGATPARWWQHSYDRDYVAYEWAALAWYAIRYRIAPFVETSSGLVGGSAGRGAVPALHDQSAAA